MDRKKLTFIIIGLLGFLFVCGLATNLIPKNEGDSGKNPGWIKALDSVLGPLAPALDPKRIKPAAGITTDKVTYQIKNDQRQRILIDAKKGVRFQRVVLNTQQAGVRFKVPASDQATGPKPAAGRLATRATKRMVVSTPMVVIPAAMGGTIDLKVMYTPADQSEETPSVWQTVESVDLVVQEAGGTLTLQCVGCSQNKPATLKIQ